MRPPTDSHPPRSILSLPQDLLVKVATHVVSSSSTPIVEISSLASSSFRQVTLEKMVERCIAVDREYSHMMWSRKRNKKYMALLRRCAAAGNQEANFILGVQLLSKHGERNAGTRCLISAKEGGHEAAAYILGMVHLQEYNTHAVGVELLNKLVAGLAFNSSDDIRSTEPGHRLIQHCRRKATSLLGMNTSWKLPKYMSLICKNGPCERIIETGWKTKEELNKSFCSPLCRWAYEYRTLMKLNYGAAS